MRDQNIVLVNTPYSNQYGESNPELDPKMPLGLMYLASTLAKHRFPVRILDANMEKMSPEKIVADIQQKPCDVLGMNVLASNVDVAISIASAIRQVLPETRILFGGIHATVAYMDILSSCTAVDACVIGEGELTLIDFLNAESMELVNGLAYRGEDGKIKTTQLRPRIIELDSLPLPAWDLIPIKKYLAHGRMSIMASRGCPYNCNFCTSRSLWHSKMSWRSPSSVLTEMKTGLERHNVREFHFLDDNFLYWPSLDEFNHIMAREDFKWRCIGRIEAITETLAIDLKRAGCDSITFGIETGTPRLQREIGKKLNLRAVPATIEICAKVGIATKAYFMIGFPTETTEEMDATIKYAIELREKGLSDVMFLPVIPYRGTELYETVRQKKGNNPNLGRVSIRVSNNNFGLKGRALRNFNKCAYYPTISASCYMTGEELISHIADAYKSFYEC
jgi:radical SAM superfamily enzyme YgiQ (UPF0313 family)